MTERSYDFIFFTTEGAQLPLTFQNLFWHLISKKFNGVFSFKNVKRYLSSSGCGEGRGTSAANLSGDDLGGRPLAGGDDCGGGGVSLELAKQFGEVDRVLVDPQHLRTGSVDDGHAAVPEATFAGATSGRCGLVDAGRRDEWLSITAINQSE